MGEHQVNPIKDKEAKINFIKHLLNDIDALEIMLSEGQIESGITRIGAEQEFCLVSKDWRPSDKALEILDLISDEHFTTELAKFNLEINLDPVELKNDCFSTVEQQLTALLAKAEVCADEFDVRTILLGILPTISKNELCKDYMTPSPRYWALNDMMKNLRGSDFEFHIKGVDEISMIHDSVLMEACNTSFQMHLQIDPDDFASNYNWSQAIAGPLLGVCCNSPLLLGRELWSETRIALFQQSIDTRDSSYALANQQPRVTFGNKWATGSIADFYKEDIAQFPIILSTPIEENSLSEVGKGRVPKLRALNLHNGTIYRWNRPCYGVGGGKAHVRIENRYIPAGPSVIDEMANLAFWVGLMKGRPKEFDHIAAIMDFRDAKSNFIQSARYGMNSVLKWKGENKPVKELIQKEFLPLAYDGLKKAAIDVGTIERLLQVIEKRTQTQTGAQWMKRNFNLLTKKMKQDDALVAITSKIHDNQQQLPVSEWEDITGELHSPKENRKVKHIMSTQLYAVIENDLADLATRIMKWNNIHHVPVKNSNDELVGILTWTHMNAYMEEDNPQDSMCISDIMEKNVITTHPEEELDEINEVMKKNGIGCMPVIYHNKLVGIITKNDLKEFYHG